jgi:ABC-type antimicrobial peptide transport system permease subunit
MWKKIKINIEIVQYLRIITQIGLTVVGSILIFFFLFLFLDKKLNTRGILLPIGIIIGIVSGFICSYRILKRFYKN